MANEFVKQMLKSNHGLFYLVHGFNHLPAHYVNYDHIAGLVDHSLLEKIQKSELGSKRFSKILLDHFKLSESFYYDFKEPRLRLALIDGGTLTKLLLYTGAAYCSERITHVIEKEAVKQLKDSMGEELYDFALKRAPLLIPEKPKFKSINVELPTVYDHILYAGQKCFEMCFVGEPIALVKRFALKFVNTIQWDFNFSTTAKEREKAWEFLHKILIKEVGSEWSVCFS